ncbi:hypothetical protein E4T42_03050 [Aureobasidium subglaciale]|nr:hypothetical protein E4T42_03050 [Aureobasidium subglaciale]
MVTARRHLSLLPAEPTETTIDSVKPSIESVQAASTPSIDLAIASVETEEAGMNSQKEAELLAIQHILGLKNATDDSVKIKPKDLERLERLKAAEPVFVCVDLEAYEFAQDKITEVGVSILDSRDIVGTDAGTDGTAWLSKIKTRHMIIKEYKHLVNKRFVHGCPDKFNFGKSETVSLRNIHQTLTQLFDDPSPRSSRPSDSGSRRLILVGHGLSNDTAYLNKLKFAPHARGNIIQDVDTQKFVGSKKQTVGLNKLMLGLGVEAENLHNAGNDAAYTLQALVLMTVQHTNEPGAYINAVANAKAKLDPAKQRYKDHKANIAKLKELKRAEKKTAALPVVEASRDRIATAPPSDETKAPNPAPRITKIPLNGSVISSLDRYGLSKSMAESDSVPVETLLQEEVKRDNELDLQEWNTIAPRNPTRPPPNRDELRARERAARKLLRENKGNIPDFKRISLDTCNGHASFPAPKPLIGSSEPESSTKRKSSDAEPDSVDHYTKHAKASLSIERIKTRSQAVRTPVEDDLWVEDDDFSISPAFASDATSRSSVPDSNRTSQPFEDASIKITKAPTAVRSKREEAVQQSFTITKIPIDKIPTEVAAEYHQATRVRHHGWQVPLTTSPPSGKNRKLDTSAEIAPSKFVDELAKLKDETLQDRTTGSGEKGASSFLDQEVEAHREKRAEDQRWGGSGSS